MLFLVLMQMQHGQLNEALEKIPVLKDLGVELVEQPLAKDDWEGMKFLFEKSPLPLFADESCVSENDVEKCHEYFHGINIKLTKCSGITPALRMIEKARELDMKVMMGCMNESYSWFRRHRPFASIN